MPALLYSAAAAFVACFGLAALLHLFPRLGSAGKALSRWLCQAPGLDLVITWFVAVPLIAAPITAHALHHSAWLALLGAVLGQYAALSAWTLAHELAHPEARKRPRMYQVHNRLIGPVRNLYLLHLTSLGVPVFWLIRVVQYAVYPSLVSIARFPKYNDADWVSVSRHKFPHLVGHDRIWCLYCDWMTGVWSLGTEMLRNVESYWCPVRFNSEAKCTNCTTMFPDLDAGWAPFTSDTATAAAVLESKYANPDGTPREASWFGHPARLTVKGREIPDEVAARV